eukprot:scaffold63843_cov34-Prasinocladus_malaysianus.AAC.1
MLLGLCAERGPPEGDPEGAVVLELVAQLLSQASILRLAPLLAVVRPSPGPLPGEPGILHSQQLEPV